MQSSCYETEWTYPVGKFRHRRRNLNLIVTKYGVGMDSAGDLKFSQWCCWRCECSGMWRRVVGQVPRRFERSWCLNVQGQVHKDPGPRRL